MPKPPPSVPAARPPRCIYAIESLCYGSLKRDLLCVTGGARSLSGRLAQKDHAVCSDLEVGPRGAVRRNPHLRVALVIRHQGANDQHGIALVYILGTDLCELGPCSDPKPRGLLYVVASRVGIFAVCSHAEGRDGRPFLGEPLFGIGADVPCDCDLLVHASSPFGIEAIASECPAAPGSTHSRRPGH